MLLQIDQMPICMYVCMYVEYGVITFGISDHYAVYFIRFIKRKATKTKPNFKRFDKEEFRHDLSDIPFSDVKAAASDTNELWDIWKNFFLAVLNKHAPPTTLILHSHQKVKLS